MLLKELLLTEIVEVSAKELKYKIMDLNSYETFSIIDNVGDKPNYRFILNILADNAIAPHKNDVKTFQRLIRKNPLFFNAVYLKTNDKGFIQNPMTTDDLAIIPNGQVRGLTRCKEQIQCIYMSMDNLKGRY